MSALLLASAQTVVAKALDHAREAQLKPLAVVVVDPRGSIVAAASQDGCALGRWQVAYGKAYGALFMGAGSRRLDAMARERPHFIAAVAQISVGGMVPVPGGVLLRDAGGEILGAVGVSGDTSDNDEAAAAAGIGAAGFAADVG